MRYIPLGRGFSARVLVCTNGESLDLHSDDDLAGMTPDEAAGAFAGAADDAIYEALGELPDHESSFEAWNGGYCYKADFGSQPVVANVYRVTADRTGPHRAQCSPSEVPASITRRLEDALYAAGDAVTSKLDET